jgi:hypothetical protein
MFWRRKKRREENTQLAKLTIEEAQKITKLCEELKDLEEFLNYHKNSYFPEQLKIGVWHNSTYFSYYTSENLTNSIISAAICRVEELKNILKNYD